MWSTITKFGLSQCDFPTMMWNVTVLLRVLTLNIDSRYTKRAPLLQYLILSVIVTCYVYVYVVSMIWFVFWKCHQTRDVIAAMVVFSLGIASQIGPAKMLFMFVFNDTVKIITRRYLASDNLVDPNTRFADNILKTLRLVKKRAMLFWIVITVNGFVYAMKPLLLPGRHLSEDVFIYYGLEPMLESPNYEIAFLCNVASCFIICYSASNITAFFIVVSGYTEAQLLALGEELNSLWSDAEVFYLLQVPSTEAGMTSEETVDPVKIKIQNEYIKVKLAEIAKIQMANVNHIQQVESLFRTVIAAEFILLIVSLIAELLGGLENTYLEIPFAMMQVAMDCFVGQRLLDASLVFETAVYNCKWEYFDQSNMKTVLLILQMSQRDINLSAGGLTTLSFGCLMSVFRNVYSTYTTLREVV